MKKKVPQTAQAYAEYLYGVPADPSKQEPVQTVRVRAFMDGVSWAKRHMRKKRVNAS
jgi:hypothetical protein